MTPDRYSRRMRGKGRFRRGARGATGVLALLALTSCDGGDDSTDGTLAVPAGGSSTTGAVDSGEPGDTASAGTGVTPANPGSGFVSIDVRVPSASIAETISLDRSTVDTSSLDPVSLDATCTPLDGGDTASGVVVSVVDLGRLAGSRLLSAVLRYGDPAPGEHDMTLELGSADQVTTIYVGTVTVGGDGMSGTFAGTDNGGTPMTGSFACAAEAIVTTTTGVPPDAGEEVPEDSPPPTVVTLPPTAPASSGASATTAVTD